MLIRQKLLLRLLDFRGGSASRLELIKLAFLLSKEYDAPQMTSFYDFVPYKFGPYSFGLAHELENLCRDGAVTLPNEEQVSLTNRGKNACAEPIDARLLKNLTHLERSYGHFDQNRLITFVYEKHPWFTALSQFADKRKADLVTAPARNYTIGYQNFQIDGLLNNLLKNGIRRLLDTRSNPVSRRYGFHRSTLSRLCAKLNISYEHLPSLGVPSDWRQELSTAQDYKTLFDRYETEILDSQIPLLKSTATRMREIPSALLCRESDAQQCHRTILANRLRDLNKMPVVNLCQHDDDVEIPILKFNSILMK